MPICVCGHSADQHSFHGGTRSECHGDMLPDTDYTPQKSEDLGCPCTYYHTQTLQDIAREADQAYAEYVADQWSRNHGGKS